MKKLLKELFPSLFPDPKVGETYIWDFDEGDPWNEVKYTIIERKGDWYLTLNKGTRISFHRNRIVSSLTKI